MSRRVSERSRRSDGEGSEGRPDLSLAGRLPVVACAGRNRHLLHMCPEYGGDRDKTRAGRLRQCGEWCCYCLHAAGPGNAGLHNAAAVPNRALLFPSWRESLQPRSLPHER